jgi:hypothetical protein
MFFYVTQHYISRIVSVSDSEYKHKLTIQTKCPYKLIFFLTSRNSQFNACTVLKILLLASSFSLPCSLPLSGFILRYFYPPVFIL